MVDNHCCRYILLLVLLNKLRKDSTLVLYNKSPRVWGLKKIFS
jgi:hypothetical protein